MNLAFHSLLFAVGLLSVTSHAPTAAPTAMPATPDSHTVLDLRFDIDKWRKGIDQDIVACDDIRGGVPSSDDVTEQCFTHHGHANHYNCLNGTSNRTLYFDTTNVVVRYDLSTKAGWNATDGAHCTEEKVAKEITVCQTILWMQLLVHSERGTIAGAAYKPTKDQLEIMGEHLEDHLSHLHPHIMAVTDPLRKHIETSLQEEISKTISSTLGLLVDWIGLDF